MAKFCAISDLHGALPKIEGGAFSPLKFLYIRILSYLCGRFQSEIFF
jgi:hypothetical protein